MSLVPYTDRFQSNVHNTPGLMACIYSTTVITTLMYKTIGSIYLETLPKCK
jgi:hypothetical protein